MKKLHACSTVILLASASLAQTPGGALPRNYQVVLETPEVRVLHAHYGPHEKVPMHEHPAYTTLFVYLNDSGVVRLSHAEGAKMGTVDRPPTHTGAFRIAPGLLERHSIENLGGVPADSVLVELKSLPADLLEKAFRGDAPKAPLLTGTSVVYANPKLRVERVICDPGVTCAVEARAVSSVLVAVTPAALFGDPGSQMLTMEKPAVMLSSGRSMGVRSVGPVPAQLLRVELLK